MSRFALKSPNSSAERSEYSSSNSSYSNYNNSQVYPPQEHAFFGADANTSYYDNGFGNYQTISLQPGESTHTLIRNSVEFDTPVQLRNMLEDPHSLNISSTRPGKILPNCESKKESKLRFRREEEFEIIPIRDPSISRDLSPPPLNRVPLRSCLKQNHNILPIVDENTVRLSHLGQSWIGGDSRAITSTELERNTPSSLNVSGNKLDVSKEAYRPEIDQNNNDPLEAKIFELDDLEKKITEKWNSRINENERVKDLNCPAPVDYWANTNYKRRNRRVQLVKKIFEVTFREIKYEEYIKETSSTLTVVEVCFDYGFLYAKCYTTGDFPVNLVIIPLRCFPIKDDVPPLGSTWTASSIQYVNVLCRNQRKERFLRLSYKHSLQFIAMIKPDIPRRIITFGETTSAFYCEMLQMYVPLRHVFDGYYNRETLFGRYGEVTFNSKVLSKLPEDIKVIEGFGWIEPKPGDIGVVKYSYHEHSWLLVERLVPHLARKHYSYEASILTEEERLAREKQREEENKKLMAYLLKKRAEGYIFHTNTPRPVRKPQTAEGAVTKRDRRELCEGYLRQIQTRGTKIPLFLGENEERLFELVLPHKAKKGTRLGLLCHTILDYLKDEKTFNYLKEDEPENLELFRLIVKWTVDYTKDRRNCLPQKLYNYIFPLADDPCFEGDRWED